MITFYVPAILPGVKMGQAVQRACFHCVRGGRWRVPERAIIGIAFGSRPQKEQLWHVVGEILEGLRYAHLIKRGEGTVDVEILKSLKDERRGFWVSIVPAHGGSRKAELLEMLTATCGQVHDCDMCPLWGECRALYDRAAGS